MGTVVYIDMDNTLVDFGARLDGIAQSILDQYRDRLDEIPGLFALMPPVEGALEGFAELDADEQFEPYILSTSPWRNPSAWQHKVEWVQMHLGLDKGTPAYKRLILSHHKDLNRGDYLIDDRPWHNGADKFVGKVIHFGAENKYPEGRTSWPANVVAHLDNWADVVAYLKKHTVAESAEL